MSLDAMLATQDEAALAAQASVGLVRRAQRDLDAGKASIEARDEASARVLADGQTVTVLAAGLGDSRCTCPATGICRHVLMAVLMLRQQETVTVVDATAIEELAALDEADLRAFAGADWEKAVAQALISDETTLTEDGVNLSVRLPDSDHQVLFLAGQALKAAVWKGPKSAKRRTVAAAALVARAKSGGQALDQVDRDEAALDSLSGDTLRSVRDAIEAIVAGVFAGSSAIAEERLFDISISVRAEAVPRLTGLLRDLVRQGRAARDRQFSYSDDRFLADAADAMALTRGLAAKPRDPALSGVLRRRYEPRDPVTLVIAGAVNWRSKSGARGLRLHAFAPEEGRWFSTGQARAGGIDPGFSPGSVYRAPIWGVGSVNRLSGQTLTLEGARVSSDHQIAWDGGMGRIDDQSAVSIDGVAEAGALFDDWNALKADLARRFPRGLKRTGAAVPVLLAPSAISGATFDDIAQSYRLSALDRTGRGLELTLPVEQARVADWLLENGKLIAAILCEARLGIFGLQLEPVTVHSRPGRDGELKVRNLTLDAPDELLAEGRNGLGQRALKFLTARNSPSVHDSDPTDAVSLLGVRITEAVAETLRHRHTETLRPLVDEADRLGLAMLARALRAFNDEPVPGQALRVSYLNSEIRKDACLL